MSTSHSPRAIPFPSELPALLPPLDAALPGDLALVDELLRDRGSLLTRIEQGRDLARLARAMILTIAFCGAALGAAAGSQRGGIQVALSAVKLPLALLLTAAICAPVLTSLNSVLFGKSDMRRDLAIVLCSLALATLVTAALTPLVVMAAGSPTVGYRRLVLVCVACAGIGGVSGLTFFLRSLRDYAREERLFAGITVLVVFALVGTQTVWTLRPYVAYPRPQLVIIHPIQGSFLDSVVTTAYTAAGLVVTERPPESVPASTSARAPVETPAVDPTPAPVDAAPPPPVEQGTAPVLPAPAPDSVVASSPPSVPPVTDSVESSDPPDVMPPPAPATNATKLPARKAPRGPGAR